MRFPPEPVALLAATVPTLGLFSFAIWWQTTRRNVGVLSVVLLAFSGALVALVLAAVATFAFESLRPFHGSDWLVAIPASIYVAVISRAWGKSNLSLVNLAVSAAIGLVLLYFVGGFASLLVACGLAGCL